jgi:oxygen-independent coproporphyrinogen-3 oxidase
MLDGIRSAFALAAGAEVTVEANPDTVTVAMAHGLAEAGVTRMSIGMQSVPHVLAASSAPTIRPACRRPSTRHAAAST